MPKFEILSIRANAINSSDPEVTCRLNVQAHSLHTFSTMYVSHCPGNRVDPGTGFKPLFI